MPEHPPTLEQFETLLKIVAIVVGGIWAYIKFFMGRVFKPRLETSIAAKPVSRNGANFILATAEAKNRGLTKCAIDNGPTGIRVFSAPMAGVRPLWVLKWTEHDITFDIFDRHQWIESGETISDQNLIPLPADGGGTVYKLEFSLFSRERYWVPRERFPWRRRSTIRWLARAITYMVVRPEEPRKENPVNQQAQFEITAEFEVTEDEVIQQEPTPPGEDEKYKKGKPDPDGWDTPCEPQKADLVKP